MTTNRQLFLDHMAQTSGTPLMLEIERAEGVFMYDHDGKPYLDLISGIGVSNVGHRHPKVMQAIQDQLDKYLHLMVYGEFVQSPQVSLAKSLVDTLPEKLNAVYLLNSGSEAVEGALKLAKRYTGRSKIMSCHNAYHGSSHGALSVTGDEEFKRNFRPLLPGIHHFNYGDISDIDLIDDSFAAVIIETVQGEAGVVQTTTEYFQALREKCNETGTLLILDEIQCGFGRTGKLWAFEHYGIEPDILLSAKGLGGGMPIGAFISSQEIMSCLKENPILGHITTFGGHPVSSAAANATIKVIQEENLIAQVQEKAELFKSLLVHPKIKSIRSIGLMMAVEFEDYDTLKPIIDRALENGVLTDWFLFCNNSMRIAPPLTITKEEIEKACELVLESI
ncbi:MAG: aspartate aminotransferase family protein [bacterium]|nr:aspartate aminotransferase family protein [bacterium]